MGPKKKEPGEGKGGKEPQETKSGKKGKEEKGGKENEGDDEVKENEEAPVEELPPGELPGPPLVVTPEFSYNKELTQQQLKEIYALSSNLEDSARCLAGILGLGDCVFDARNLMLLEYCLGNLMFAKNAGLNLKQALEIYDMGHMILEIIRAGNPVFEAERFFKTRLLSHSIIKYQYVPPVDPCKEPAKPETSDKPSDEEKVKDESKKKEDEKEKTSDGEKSKESKKSKGGDKKKGGEKGKGDENEKELKKAKGGESPPKKGGKLKDDDKTKKSKEDKIEVLDDKPMEEVEEPERPIFRPSTLFSPYDVERIAPYFVTTVFRHYCLFQYCFTKVHYNIRKKERVYIETAVNDCPLSRAKSQEEVEAEEAARVIALEKARQDAHIAKVMAEQEMFNSLAAEAARLAEEELKRRPLNLEEHIEMAVRHKINETKKAIMEELEHREQMMINKVLETQRVQAEAAALAETNAAIAAKNAPPAGKDKPPAEESKEPQPAATAGKKKGK